MIPHTKTAWFWLTASSIAAVAALGVGAVSAAPPPAPPPPQSLAELVGNEAMAKIKAAAPAGASVKPQKVRKVLVLTESLEDLHRAATVSGHKFVPHTSAPHCAEAVAELGRKSGAFEATVVTSAEGFTPESLRQYDAIVLANVYLDKKLFGVPSGGVDKKSGKSRPQYLQEEEKPIYAARQKAFAEFINSGKGLVGIHNAAAAAVGWPEYNVIIGGTHFGHVWWARQTTPLKLDDPQSPLCAAFGGKEWEVKDDIYYFTAPYSRENVHVLVSANVAKAPKSRTDDRPDGDYPVSWIKTHGQGRVFYTALGHQAETFQNATFLKHLLDGIQYALGDLKADAVPGKSLPARASFAAMPGYTPLFDGKVSPELNLHPKDCAPRDGVIPWVMGPGTCHSCVTKQTYGDYDLRVDFRLPCMSDSGVFVKRNIQANIWGWNQGSGQLWGVSLPPGPDGKKPSTDPTSREDRATGEWNTFFFRVKGNRLTTVLNDVEVMNVLLPENNTYEQTVSLQNHTEPAEFKNIYIRPIEAPK